MPSSVAATKSHPSTTQPSVKIRTLADRARLAEYIVEKRSKLLIYLVQLHAPHRQGANGALAATPPLWMGTVRIHRAEILRHFLVPEELIREEAVVRPTTTNNTTTEFATSATQSGGPTSTILAAALTLGNHAQSRSSGPVSPSSRPPCPPSPTSSPLTSLSHQQHHLSPAVLEPYSLDASKAAGTPQYPLADAAWVREHCTKWALLGACLPGILQAPLYSPPSAFIDAFYQLLLEIDVFLEGSDTAAKLLAIRTLKSYRSDHLDRVKRTQGMKACQIACVVKSKSMMTMMGGGGGNSNTITSSSIDAMMNASDVQDAFLQTDANGGNAPVVQMMSRRYDCQAHAASRGKLGHVRSKTDHNLAVIVRGGVNQNTNHQNRQNLSVAEMVEEENHDAYNQELVNALMGGTVNNAFPLAAFHSTMTQRKHILAAMGLGVGGGGSSPSPVFVGGGGGGGSVNSSKTDADANKAAKEEWEKALEGVEASFLESKGSFKYHYLDVEVAASILGSRASGGGGGGIGGGGSESTPKRPPHRRGDYSNISGERGATHADPWSSSGAMPSAQGKGPSYDVVTPALCKVLATAYNKLADYSALGEPNAIETILAIDKKLKHDFFGALSRQLGVLAQAKLRQQASFLTDGIFGSYSSAGREIGAWLPQGGGGAAGDGSLLAWDEGDD